MAFLAISSPIQSTLTYASYITIAAAANAPRGLLEALLSPLGEQGEPSRDFLGIPAAGCLLCSIEKCISIELIYRFISSLSYLKLNT